MHLLIVERSKPAPCFLGLNLGGNYSLVADPLVEMPRGWVRTQFALSLPRGSRAKTASETRRAS